MKSHTQNRNKHNYCAWFTYPYIQFYSGILFPSKGKHFPPTLNAQKESVWEKKKKILHTFSLTRGPNILTSRYAIGTQMWYLTFPRIETYRILLHHHHHNPMCVCVYICALLPPPSCSSGVRASSSVQSGHNWITRNNKCLGYGASTYFDSVRTRGNHKLKIKVRVYTQLYCTRWIRQSS